MTLKGPLLGIFLAAALATPLSAAPDARTRGEALFFEHSFGGTAASVPLKVYEVLADLYPERYARAEQERRYGLLTLPDRVLPVGFVSTQAFGAERLSFNCSLCHTGRIAGTFVPGLPNKHLRMQEFEEDLMATLRRDDFTPARVTAAIEARHPDLGWVEGLQIRLWLALARPQAERFVSSSHRGGPGRFDLLQTFKKRLGLPAHTFNAEMDIPSLFGTRTVKRYPRDGALGGDQDLVRYLIVRLSGDNAPLIGGRPPDWVRELNTYLASLTPPPYPYPVDAARAARGHAVFRSTCTPCHGTYEAYDEVHPNRIVPLAVVGTDPNRVAVWDAPALAYVAKDPLMRRLDLQPGVGMLPPSLRGVWATSPYLHNGSVPTLYDVLSAPPSRPTTFRRGGDAFDPARVGLPAGEGAGDFLFDTRIAGNGNQGHPFGEPLNEDERLAVIEYLKTL